MALPALPVLLGELLRAEIFCLRGDQIGVNVHWWKVTQLTAGPPADFAWLVNEIDGTMSAFYKPLLATTASYYGLQIAKYTPSGVGTVPYTNKAWTGAGTGTAGDCLPRQVAGLINWRTGLAGRSQRGRSYIPFPSEGDNDANDNPSVAYTAALNALGTNVREYAYNVPGGAILTLQKALVTLSPGGPGSGTIVYLINEHRARAGWATQRRRGDFGKQNIVPF